MTGGLAARVMGWQRRMRTAPGPLGASGEAAPAGPILVELFIDGTWVDITDYVLVRDDNGEIALTRGIRDEGGQTEQSTARLLLKNQDGRFSPRNPTGPYYGRIGRNQPLRISVPDGLGGKAYRFRGEVSTWPTSWDPTGTDVWADVTAGGILRRLAQGPASEHSVIYNAVTAPLAPSVVAYWPCEDPEGSTRLASALTNGSGMTLSGTVALASYSGVQASDPLPDLSAGSLSGGVTKYADPTAHQVRFLLFVPQAGLTDGKVICAIDQQDYSAGSPQFWELYYSATSNSLTMRTHDADGNALGAELPHTVDVRGRLMYVSVEQQERGTGVDRAVRITDVATGTVYAVTDSPGLTQLTRIVRVQFGPASRSVVGPIGTQFLPGVSVGHVTVETAITATTALGVRLNPIGEAAGRRIQRLCGESGIAFDWVGDLDDTVAMGAQGKANPLALMQECALADGGMLYENLAVLGLGYRTRASLYNQDPALVLSYTGYNLAEVPTPVEDDQRIANKVTVTVGGVSETYEETSGPLSTALPPAGVGEYGSDVTLNLQSTASGVLRDQAAWRVHLGTVNEARYPQISVHLSHASFTANPALRRAVLGLRQGDRVQIQNPPPWLPPDTIDQIVLGVEETLTHFEHRLTFMCAPASPYTVGVLDDAAARIDTDGSVLVAGVGSSDTSLVVGPAAGVTTLWTTDRADAPFTVQAGGETMTVTAVTGWLEDTFTRSVSSGWGSPDAGSAWSAVGGGSASDYLVNGTAGVHVLSTVEVSRRTAVTAAGPDFDVYCDLTTSALALGDSLYGAVTARMLDSSNMYMARLEFTTSNTVILTIRKIVADTTTNLGTYTVPVTHVAGAYVRVRFQGIGSALRAKAWPASDPVEEPSWGISVVDSSITEAYSIGTRSIRITGNTNLASVEIRHDNYRVVSPQKFTVTRSANGVVKSHAAGEDIRLASSVPLAL